MLPVSGVWGGATAGAAPQNVLTLRGDAGVREPLHEGPSPPAMGVPLGEGGVFGGVFCILGGVSRPGRLGPLCPPPPKFPVLSGEFQVT